MRLWTQDILEEFGKFTYAGVTDEYIQLPEGRDCLRYELLPGLRLADVSRNCYETGFFCLPSGHLEDLLAHAFEEWLFIGSA